MNSVSDLSAAERSNYLSALASILEATGRQRLSFRKQGSRSDYAARRISNRKGIEGILRTLQPPQPILLIHKGLLDSPAGPSFGGKSGKEITLRFRITYSQDCRSWEFQIQRVDFLDANIPHDEWRVVEVQTAPRVAGLAHINARNILKPDDAITLVIGEIYTIQFRAVLTTVFEIGVLKQTKVAQNQRAASSLTCS